MKRFASMSLAGLATVLLALSGGARSADPPPAPSLEAPAPDAAMPVERLVLVVVDSARPEFFTNGEVMPRLSALTTRPDAVWFQIHSCSANFTFPCLQTVFEGRRSPFAGGLVQFLGAGREGALDHFFAQAEARGRRIAIVANHTLIDTYGRHARWTYNPYRTAPDYYTADTLAIARTMELLAQPNGPEVLVLHLVGPDKAGHFYQFGSEGYLRYWRQADEAIAAIAEQLDLRREGLVVMGDHGHDAGGAHTRETGATLLGAPLTSFARSLSPTPSRLEQEDWMFVLAYAAGLTLPAGYEGNVWLPSEAAPASASFSNRLGTWLASRGFSEGPLSRQVDAFREAPKDEAWRALVPWAPVLLAWLLAAAVVVAVGFGPLPDAPRWVRPGLLALPWLAAAGAIGPWLGIAPVAWLAMVAVAILGAAAMWALRDAAPRSVYRFRLLMALGASAIATGWFAMRWMDAFHIYANEQDRFPYEGFAFSALFLSMTWFALRLLRWPARWLPFAAFPVSMVALPSGVYLHQRGQNWVQTPIMMGGLLLLVLAWRHREELKRRWHADGLRSWRHRIAFGALGLLMFRLAAKQRGNSWQWVSGWQELAPNHPKLVLGLGVLAALSFAFAGRRRSTQLALGTAALGSWLIAVGPLRLDPGLALSALLPVSAVALLWRAIGPAWFEEVSPLRAEALGWALAATSVASLWAALSGFRIWNIELDFASHWFHGAPTDAQLFGTLFVPVLFKYGFGILLLALLARHLLGERAFAAVSREATGALGFAATATVAQAAAMRASIEEKLFELAAVCAIGLVWAALAWWGSAALAQRLAALMRRVAPRPSLSTEERLAPAVHPE